MAQDHDTEFGSMRGQLDAESDTPPPPPPMPTPRLASAPAAAGSATARSASTDGWAVDPYSLNGFAYAIDAVREWLRVVDEKVEQMRSASYTPKLGTSPVAVQLERKFADRLDAPLDDPRNPTSGGLRPMLAEAMRRMEEFVSGAEDALRQYREFDQTAASQINRAGGAG